MNNYKHHNGGALASNAFLIDQPDPNIGKIISVGTNLEDDGKLIINKVIKKLIQFSTFVWVGLFLSLILQVWFGGLGWILGGILGVIAGVPSHNYLLPRQSTYVGEKGLQISTKKASGIKKQILRFEEAESIVTYQVNQYMNGIHTGLRFNYNWFKNGEKLFKIEGQQKQSKMISAKVEAAKIWYFAQAAEKAWSKFYVVKAQREFDTTGKTSFFFPGKKSGRDELILNKDQSFTYKSKNIELHWKLTDIKQFEITKGLLKILTKDGFKRNIGFSTITNNSIFVFFLDKHYGIKLFG
jgi:hypothetical protein